MPLTKSFLLFCTLIFSTCALLAQVQIDSALVASGDTPVADPADPINETSTVADGQLFRPRVEAGLGVLTYYGDVGNLGGTGRTPQLNWGYSIALKNRISNSFGLDIFAMFGKVSGREDVPGGNADFETPIRMGGLSLNYNFNALLPTSRWITPYVSVGFSTFEFNPKGDRYDAAGNQYHYWSDGTIRNTPESLAKSPEAAILQRDGVYETDLRETSREVNSTYPLRAFSVPVGAGANLRITNSFSVNMGATFHFSLTDNIDNINSENSTYSSGKKGNDYLLFSSIGLAYDLHYRSSNPAPKQGVSRSDFPALEFEDEDNDGVADIVDLCPFTPVNARVDMYGCPVDSDEDGVPDYADLEPNTPRGTPVNADGVGLTDEDFENMYLAYMDTVGNLRFNKSQTYTADVNHLRATKRSKSYRIEFENTFNMTGEEIGRLLSISDIKSEEGPSGTIYYIGEYESLNEVLARQAQLQNNDFNTRLIFDKFGNAQVVNEEELSMLLNAYDPDATNFAGVTFRVQIGAYRYKLSKNVFSEVPNLLTIQGSDGLTRYVSGSYKTIQEAARHKIDLLLEGFDGAFVTAYRNGKRITLKEAGATVTAEEDITSATETQSINKDLVKYTVQLGSFNGRVPADVLNQYMTLGNVRPVRGANGTTKYVYGIFESAEIANAKRRELTTEGFKDAFVVGEFNGQVISAEEARKILTQ